MNAARSFGGSELVLSKTSFQPLYPNKKTCHAERLKRLRRTVLNTGNLLSARPDASAFYWVMVTLTYAPGREWSPKHISGFMGSVRKYLKDTYRITKLHYMWVMELQKRGAPHYHVLIRLRHGVTIPKPDADNAGWWCLGITHIQRARHAVGYLAKYTSKGTSLEQIHLIPKGARLHGASILDPHEMHMRRWWNLPRWVRDVVRAIQPIKRVKGGFATKTGEFLPTPYLVEFEHGMMRISLNAQVIEEYGYELSS